MEQWGTGALGHWGTGALGKRALGKWSNGALGHWGKRLRLLGFVFAPTLQRSNAPMPAFPTLQRSNARFPNAPTPQRSNTLKDLTITLTHGAGGTGANIEFWGGWLEYVGNQ